MLGHKQKPGPRKLSWWKWVLIAWHFGRAGWVVGVRFSRLAKAQRQAEIREWSVRMLRALDVEVQCPSPPPADFAGLVVSNHLSWMDILVLQAILPGTFVAKTEVRSWPVVGSLAQACGTIFVNRSSPRSARAMVDHTVSAIAQGQAVIVFPEGTSTNGDDLAPFHANIFESAVRSEGQVQLLTLRYRDKATGELARGVHFTGTMSLLDSLRTITRLPATHAVVHIGDRVPATGHTRKSLSEHAYGTMRAQLLATARP